MRMLRVGFGCVCCMVWSFAAVRAATPAFPGAEGFGAMSRGGRGGKVLFVDNLRDYVPGREEAIAGSLRAALSASGPRTILFRVAGTIELRAGLRISEPFVTIAGQSAPGGGICLKNYGVGIRTHDVVLRHLRLRPGDEVGRQRLRHGKHFDTDGLGIGEGSRNVIVDHCSVSWANDEVLSVSGPGISDVTVQWCLITESLDNSTHHKGRHGYGSLIRTNGDITFHHNIYAHHRNRCPRPGTYGDGSILLDFRNNLVFDGVGYSGADPVRMNYVGNVIVREGKYAFKAGGKATRIHAADNLLIAPDTKRRTTGWSVLGGLHESARLRAAFKTRSAVTMHPASALEAVVLAGCGAILPKRDSVDRRVVDRIAARRFGLIDSQDDVGGWPALESGRARPDSDSDGMPDAWETQNGLDPHRAGDAVRDGDRDGYTNIEEFLSGTDPRKAD